AHQSGGLGVAGSSPAVPTISPTALSGGRRGRGGTLMWATAISAVSLAGALKCHAARGRTP
ncbi:MAG: hypothetical protein QGD89_09545, partial [Actinomycetota bacterium]|nr:hypothetical protein [Actinomycetota bacterium]